MKKYLTIIKITWQRALIYKFSVYTYRIGEIISVIALVLLWSAIYSRNEMIKGYTYNEMITYVLIGSLIDVIVRNWLYEVVADDIKSGLLSNFIIKPIQYLNYIISREIGRISFAFTMSVLTQSFIILMFYKKIILD